MAVLIKVNYNFNTISIKTPVAFFFFAEIGKLILKFIWKCKAPRIAKVILKKNKKKG